MIKFIKAGIVCMLCLVCLTECSNDNQGFPDEVIFPAEGGRISLISENAVYVGCIRFCGEIQSCDIEYDDSKPDSILISYDWLSVKARIGDKKIVLIANDKNSTYDVIDLSISFDPDPEARIKVKRK